MRVIVICLFQTIARTLIVLARSLLRSDVSSCSLTPELTQHVLQRTSSTLAQPQGTQSVLRITEFVQYR